MKIVLAFDSFKGCLTSREVCRTAREAIHTILPEAELIELPLSDGGEGLVQCMRQNLTAEVITFKAHDPLMQPIQASYVITPDRTAYMEMAATSGLTLVPPKQRNPMLTTTYGVGEMLMHASQHGCRHIVIGIGGSATCDGGQGMVQALRDANVPSSTLPPITIASDVTNPLYGPHGAAFVFGPQKGATPQQVQALDQRLRDFARHTEEQGIATPELAQKQGAGAAGGLGYGLMAYLKAEMKSGIDIMLDINHFSEYIKDADIVITGEGKSDAQTLMGKVPYGVLRACRQQWIPVWLISGGIEDLDGRLASNFFLVQSINEGDSRPLTELTQPQVAKENLTRTLQKLISL